MSERERLAISSRYFMLTRTARYLVGHNALVGQAGNPYALGELRNAEQLLARDGELVRALNLPGVAARIQARDPEVQTVVGNCVWG